MRKTVSPVVGIVVLVVVVLIAVVLFARAAKMKRVQYVRGIGLVDITTGRRVTPRGALRRAGPEGEQRRAQRGPRSR